MQNYYFVKNAIHLLSTKNVPVKLRLVSLNEKRLLFPDVP